MAEESPTSTAHHVATPSTVSVSCSTTITPMTTVTMANAATVISTGRSDAMNFAPVPSEVVDCTIVPVGWKRTVEGGAVTYMRYGSSIDLFVLVVMYKPFCYLEREFV